MSVNNIDFTLGSYNPNQAAGLIAMAQENDRKISDSLKGILDGFEKTARSNADVQAMNYINSLGLQDMTPDKMPEHTQALEQIAGNMGGLNPSKEALTALDGRGNVLTERAMNDASLEAQGIANTSNRFNMEKEGDKRVLDIALNSVIANPSMAEAIKNTLPLHLRALFDDQALYRKQEHESKLNDLNESIETQQATSAYNTIYAYLPLFKSSDGMVDYDSMFKSPDVLKALGTDINNPRVLGKVLQTMDKKSAEEFEAAFNRSMKERQVGVAEGNLKLGETRLEQEGEQWKVEQDSKKEEAQRKAEAEASKQARDQANKINGEFQKGIKDSVFYGSVSKNAEGSLSVEPAKLASSISNRLSTAARPVEITYKNPTVDDWWVKNPDFGVSNFNIGANFSRQEGVRKSIKTEFKNFTDPNGKTLSKDTQIAMLEKLRASANLSTNLGITTVQDVFGKSPYYKKGKINMNALHADVINDRVAQANERVRAESFKISQDAANLGIELKMLNGHFLDNLARQYPTADPSFINSIYLADHNPEAVAPLSQGKGKGNGRYTNNAMDFFKNNNNKK